VIDRALGAVWIAGETDAAAVPNYCDRVLAPVFTGKKLLQREFDFHWVFFVAQTKSF
jgi:hypothetical protein